MSFIVSTLLSLSFAATAPIHSKEEIKFISKDENKLLGIFNTDAYVGVIGRIDEKTQDLSVVDLYAFKDNGKISMNEAVCKDYLKQVYGPLDKITLKVKNIKVYKSHTGNTCEAQADDPDQKSTIPERRIIIGFLNAKPYAIEFNLAKKSTPDVQENIRKFWDSLR